MNKKFIDTIKTIIIVAVLTIGGGYAYAIWIGPPDGIPPSCPPGWQGCDVPINEGTLTQTKRGGIFASDITAVHTLGVNLTTFVTNSLIKLQVNGKVGADAYCDQLGNNCIIPPGGGGGGFWQQITGSQTIENTNTGKVKVNGRIIITGGKPFKNKVLTAVDETGLARWRNIAELDIPKLVVSCPTGQAINAINPDQTPSCIDVNSGTVRNSGTGFLFILLSGAVLANILAPDPDPVSGGGGGGCRSGGCPYSSRTICVEYGPYTMGQTPCTRTICCDWFLII